MISDAQHEALAVLREDWSLSPDVRLGQLIAQLGFLGEICVGRGLGYSEDDELVAILYRHRAELVARTQGKLEEAPPPAGPAVSVSGSSALAEAASACDTTAVRDMKCSAWPRGGNRHPRENSLTFLSVLRSSEGEFGSAACFHEQKNEA
jgi:hypothetical protein